MVAPQGIDRLTALDVLVWLLDMSWRSIPAKALDSLANR
jgi:hypothetical protein